MVIFASQVSIIFVGGRAFNTIRITGVQWAICIGLAFISCPWAMLIRTIPDDWVQRFWLCCGQPVVGVLAAMWNAVATGFMRVVRQQRRRNGES